jgi:hypothetical protein
MKLPICALCAALLVVHARPALTDTLKKPDLDRLVAAQRAAPSATFRDFIQ